MPTVGRLPLAATYLRGPADYLWPTPGPRLLAAYFWPPLAAGQLPPTLGRRLQTGYDWPLVIWGTAAPTRTERSAPADVHASMSKRVVRLEHARGPFAQTARSGNLHGPCARMTKSSTLFHVRGGGGVGAPFRTGGAVPGARSRSASGQALCGRRCGRAHLGVGGGHIFLSWAHRAMRRSGTAWPCRSTCANGKACS